MKSCPNCSHIKPLNCFNNDATRNDGKNCWCKDCTRASKKVWREKNHAKAVTYNAAWNKANPDKVAIYRRKSWVKLYGISWEDYLAIIVAQGGACAICRADKPGKRLRTWMIDHDHATGAVRGVLCENCNRALGMMKDDPARLRAAAVYLECHAVKRAA